MNLMHKYFSILIYFLLSESSMNNIKLDNIQLKNIQQEFDIYKTTNYNSRFASFIILGFFTYITSL